MWIGLGFVIAAVAAAGAAYFGMRPADVSNTAAISVTSALQRDKTGDENTNSEITKDTRVIDGACQFGTCFWTKVKSQSVVANKPEGRLLRLVSSDAEHTFPNGEPDNAKPPASLVWGKENTSYVLCSKRMPMFIDTDGQVTLVKSWGTASVGDTNIWLLWNALCQNTDNTGFPSEEDTELYQTAIESKRFNEPKTIFGSLPTYPSWLISKWGWNPDDPQCLDSHIGFKTDHTLDHYEMSGRWMVVGNRFWTAWNAYVDDEGSTESSTFEQHGSDQLLMDGEPFFRCASQD